MAQTSRKKGILTQIGTERLARLCCSVRKSDYIGKSVNHLYLSTRIGSLVINWNEAGQLLSLDWADRSDHRRPWSALGRHEIPDSVSLLVNCLKSYFEQGNPLGSVPWSMIDQSGWSEFQREVYAAAEAIPHGETRTYSWIAHRIRRGAASRAVGQALRRNPLPILIPCHRVTGANNALGGFLGVDDPNLPELRLKRQLLQLEESYLNPPFSFLASIWSPAQMTAHAGA